MGIDPKTAAEPTLSAARLAVAVRRARAEAGRAASLFLAEPIAIVGMGCRFPGGESGAVSRPAEYWRLLEEGRSGIREIPEGRWAGVRERLEPHMLLGGYLDDVDRFDAEFFGIAPREAHTIDPQQRLLLEVCWEALSDAGIAPSELSGSDTGVFVAVYSSDYARLQLREDVVSSTESGSQAGVGAAHSVASGRLSFLLNLRGPCMTVDTACSSSLVATHLACQSLRQRECSVALVGGASLKLLPDEVRAFAQWGMLAHDGRAKTFDAAADGFVPGEGCGVLVLKRLSDAVAHGDTIRAVIRGSAVGHDGRSSVLTAPNGPAQEAVMLAALRDAQVTADDVSFVETHGTGTSLGDPIEVEALDAVYGAASGSGAECVLGAVKTNFGHLEAAAGLAGLMKVVLALEQESIPRNLNFERLNPQIRLGAGSRLRLATEGRGWARGSGRFAAVSSFGLGGTNAHVILEEAPVLPRMAEAAAESHVEYCLPVSAHSAEGLLKVAGEFAALLRRPGVDLGILARAAARGRDHAAFRMAVSGATAAEVAEKLETQIAAFDLLAADRLAQVGDGPGKLAFVFSGQGSLWVGMLDGLLRGFPEAEKVFAVCERVTMEAVGWSLRTAADDSTALEDTAKAQPVLFAMQMALVRVLEGWGVRADAVAGHSVGEVAAAVSAGVLTLEEGMRLVLRRGERMASAGPGRMLAAEMSETEALVLWAGVRWQKGQEPELAAVNGPQSVVFSGQLAGMQLLAELLQDGKVATRWLDVQYAFHSAAMEPARLALEGDLRAGFGLGIRKRPQIALVSTVTGQVWSSSDGDAAYWGRGIRERVRFREALGQLLELGCRAVMEIGPHPVLPRAVAACADVDLGQPLTTIAAMRRGQTARATLMAAVAGLYELGGDVDWRKVYPGSVVRAELPAYPWNRQRYWLAERPVKAVSLAAQNASDAGQGLLGREISSAFVEGKVFETLLGMERFPWLAEHCWHGRPVLPFAAWLELARRAAVAVAGDAEPVVVREFAVHRRLELGVQPVALQTLATVGRELKLAAKAGSGWEGFASGFWAIADGYAPRVLDIAAVKSRAVEKIEADEVYGQLEANGLTYGPAFRLLRSIHAGVGFALGEIVGSEAGASDIHPALLDACLQTLQAAQTVDHRGIAVLPVSVRSYRVYGTANEVFALAEMRSASGDEAEANITIADRRGVLVAEIRGLRVRRVADVAVGKATMWRTGWRLVADGAGEPGHVADAEAEVLAGSLKEVTALLLAVVRREQADAGSITCLRVVTRGAMAVCAGEMVDPEQAALLGLVRSFRAEYPAVAVLVLDLPLMSEADAEPGLFGQVANEARDSYEVAIRGGRFFRPGLENFGSDNGSDNGPDGEYALGIGTPGLLESLREEPCAVPDPAEGEIQIACRVHGLNFRDVLTAMGSYAGAAAPLGAECAGVVLKAGSKSGFAVGTAVVAFAPGSLRTVVNVPASFAVAKPAGMSFAEAATVPVAFLTAHYAFSKLARLSAGQTVLVHSAAGGLGMAAVQLARRPGATVIATAGTAEKRAYLISHGIEHVFDSRTDEFANEVLRVTDGRGVDVVLNSLSGEKIAAGFCALARGGAFLEVGKRDIWSAERVAKARPDARYWAFDLGEVALREPGLIQEMLREIFEGFARGELVPLPFEMYAMDEAESAFRHMASGRHLGKLVLTRETRRLSSQEWTAALREGSVLITGGTGALGLATARWLLEQGTKRVVLVGRRKASEVVNEFVAEFAGRVVLERGDVADREQLGAVLDRVRAVDGAPLRLVIHAAGEVDDRLLADLDTDGFAVGMRTKVDGARLLEEMTKGDSLVATVYFSSVAALLGSAGQGSYAAANAYLDGLAEERSARGLRTLSVNWGAWAGGGMAGRLSEAAMSRATRQGMRPMLPAAALEALGEAILSGRARATIADVDWVAYEGQFPAGTAARGFLASFLPGRMAEASEKPVPSHVNRDAEEIAAIRGAARVERTPRMEVFVRAAARKVLGLSAGRPMPAEMPLQELGLDSLMALEMRNMLAQAMGRPLSATLLFDYPTIRGLAGYLLSLFAEMTLQDPDRIGEEQTSGAKAHETSRTYITGVKTPAYQSEASLTDLDAELAAMSDAEAEELLLAELDHTARKGQS